MFWFQKPDVIIILRTVAKKRINVTIWLVSLKVSVQVLLPNQIHFRWDEGPKAHQIYKETLGFWIG